LRKSTFVKDTCDSNFITLIVIGAVGGTTPPKTINPRKYHKYSASRLLRQLAASDKYRRGILLAEDWKAMRSVEFEKYFDGLSPNWDITPKRHGRPVTRASICFSVTGQRGSRFKSKATSKASGTARFKRLTPEWCITSAMAAPRSRTTSAMCQNLLDRYDNLFEFTHHPIGLVEPTNNAGERALRHPVIWKQLSFGTQSSAGSRFVETLLTIVETCRQQGRDPLQFLVNAVTALFQKRRAPLIRVSGV
jgi:hypothetical protein